MHDWRRALSAAVAGSRAEVRFAEPLARHTTFRIGGLADAWVRADDRQALTSVLQSCRTSGTRWWLLGRGSNVLVSDQGLRGVVVTLGGELAEVQSRGTGLVCGAGAALDAVVTFAEESGLVGVEFLAGIPGTVGGGLRSNAGAFGHSLADVVSGITVIDRDGNERMLASPELRREYRRPMIEDGLAAVDVLMDLSPGRPKPAAVTREERWTKHPQEPSAGSFFRNPEVAGGERIPAGRLIDQCGLKGKSVGGAKVSEKHANFIVNTGGARFADVYQLAQIVKARVERETGILLEEEVQYLPERVAGQAPGHNAQGKVRNGPTGGQRGRAK
jgi:UDP-N-acetylmuramate dehydrogenase